MHAGNIGYSQCGNDCMMSSKLKIRINQISLNYDGISVVRAYTKAGYSKF